MRQDKARRWIERQRGKEVRNEGFRMPPIPLEPNEADNKLTFMIYQTAAERKESDGCSQDFINIKARSNKSRKQLGYKETPLSGGGVSARMQ